MQITATQRFRHGYDTYEDGDTYDVPAEIGGYFVLNGWANSPDLDSPADSGSTAGSLEIHDGHHDHDAER